MLKNILMVMRACAALVACACAGAGLLGCYSDPPGCLIGDEVCLRGGRVDKGGGGGAVEKCSSGNEGRELFAGLQGDLVSTCGGCHGPSGLADTPFLRGPDYYTSLTSWPDVVMRDPAQSKLLTHPRSGSGHVGTNLDAPGVDPTLVSRVQAWLAAEAIGLACEPEAAGSSTTPRTPIDGFNAIYLGDLGAAFEGMGITFIASDVNTQRLTLSQMKVTTASGTGLHLAHPLFLVVVSGSAPDPDPVDSFSNVDRTFGVGDGDDLLGPGLVTLSNWYPGAKLAIAFETIEKVDAQGAAQGAGGCKAVGVFSQKAEPQLQSHCMGCHGGGLMAAFSALDMSDLGLDSAAVCGRILGRVDLADPEKSVIFMNTHPGGAEAHPFKFLQDEAAFVEFKSAVTEWIVAEQ